MLSCCTKSPAWAPFSAALPVIWRPLLWAVFLIGAPGVLQARTWIVDQGGAGDFLTVTEACDASSSGDTVLIRPGEYDEWTGAGGIGLEAKTVSLIGAGARPEDVTIHATFSVCRGANTLFQQLRVQGVGRAIYAGGEFPFDDTLTVRACSFEDNYTPGSGGAIEMGAAYLIVEDSVFARNRAGPLGGAIYAANLAIRRTLFIDNVATEHGGAFFNGGSLILEDSIFIGNEAANGAGVTTALWEGTVFRSCTFLNNRTSPAGAAIEITVGGIDPIEQCIIAGTVNGYGIGCWDAAVAQCCDSWANEYGDDAGDCGWADFWGDFSADPLFCDAEGGDVGLMEGSPCLPGNHGGVECGLIGAKGLGCIVGTKVLSWGRVKSLFR